MAACLSVDDDVTRVRGLIDAGADVHAATTDEGYIALLAAAMADWREDEHLAGRSRELPVSETLFDEAPGFATAHCPPTVISTRLRARPCRGGRQALGNAFTKQPKSAPWRLGFSRRAVAQGCGGRTNRPRYAASAAEAGIASESARQARLGRGLVPTTHLL
jgi:hypothetical protein